MRLLLAGHAHRMDTDALTAMLAHLTESAFIEFLSAQQSTHAYDAALTFGPDPVVLWLRSNPVGTARDHPLVAKLALQQLEVLAHELEDNVRSVMALEVRDQAHTKLRAAFGTNAKAWQLASQLSSTRKVATLDELIAVVTQLAPTA